MQTITIVQHNVNKWHNKNIALYNIYRHINADIILLNHTGTTNNENIHIQHYTTYTKNPTNSQFRGTAIAIKNTIQHKLIDDFSTDLIAIQINTRQGPIKIATDYIGPNAAYLNYIDYNTLIRTQTPVYIMGDLNARHRTLGNSNCNNIGKSLHTLITEKKLKHIGPFFPTFINTRASTTPDIVLGNNKIFHNIHLTPGPNTPSDHIPIIAKISANPIQIPIRPRLQYSNANWNQYKTDLTNTPNINLQNATTAQIDTVLESLTNNIINTGNQHIPKLAYRIPPGAKTNNTIDSLQQQYYQIYNTIHTLGHTPTLGATLIQIRRQLRLEYQKQHDNTLTNIIDKINNDDTNNFWRSYKRFQGNNKQSTPYIRDHHNNRLYSDNDKENLFRQHYTKIFTPYTTEEDEDNNFDTTHIQEIDNIMTHLEQNLTPHDQADMNRLNTTLQPITTDHLIKLIQDTKQKAPGPSGITSHHLKNLPPKTITDLVHIFNTSLSIGYFPKLFKQSHTILLPKGNLSQTQLTNYRPITLTETHGKIFDKILNQSLYTHLRIRNKLNDKQHGFTHFRGTHTALATLHEKIAFAKHNKHKLNLIMRDVSKAFDKVWHTGLKYKLTQLQLHPCLLKTIINYFTNRYTSIRINQTIGTPFPINCGVPQGGCLSPTLYNIYNADLPAPTTFSDHIIYADDITQIIQYPTRSKFLHIYTQKAIENINKFERKWKIKTNTSKFKILPLFHQPTTPITIDSNIIQYADKAKVLGLTLSKYGYTAHVTNNIQKAQATLNKLHRFNTLSTKYKTLLYKSIILPTLIYPTIPLNTLSTTQHKKLQKIQNDAIRFITDTNPVQRIRMTTLHELIPIDTVNKTIHKQAHDTWARIQNTQPRLYSEIAHNMPFTNTQYRSSRILAETIPPAPIFTA